MATRGALARRISDVSRLDGEFVLRSGRRATEYFDKYRFESDPDLLRQIAAEMASMVPAGIEGLAGLELGGVPLAVALASATGLPAYFVRKRAKAYGTRQIAEGGDVRGKRLVIIEDVVTSGGQIAISAGDLRAAGAIVHEAVCVIDREDGAVDALGAQGVALRSLFRISELS